MLSYDSSAVSPSLLPRCRGRNTLLFFSHALQTGVALCSLL